MKINKIVKKTIVMGLIVLSIGTTTANAQTVENKKDKMSLEQVAELVIQGKYGNGETRKRNLAKEGYDYKSIQSIINDILRGNKSPTNTKASIPDIKSMSVNPDVKSTPENRQKTISPSRSSDGRMKTMQATAYSVNQKGMGRYTANGTDLLKNSRVIAVDPKVIPLGTKVEVEGYGEFIAADTGGAIKGNRIDIHFNTVKECINFGRRNVNIRVLD